MLSAKNKILAVSPQTKLAALLEIQVKRFIDRFFINTYIGKHFLSLSKIKWEIEH